MIPRPFRRRLASYFHILNHCNDYHSYIPPISKNYNYNGNRLFYAPRFLAPYVSGVFPSLIRLHTLSESLCRSKNPRILDIGCGFGPLALAYKIYLDAGSGANINPEHSPVGTGRSSPLYLGIDIRNDSISFLKSAYRHDLRFMYAQHDAHPRADYIGNWTRGSTGDVRTNPFSDGSEASYKTTDFQADLQWSSSLLTHLTPASVENCLSFISATLSPTGYAVNTALVVDSISSYCVRSMQADRQLPYDFGPFLSYSRDNPLVCTAYKYADIDKMYRLSGLKIVDIVYGSWRSPRYSSPFQTYQDVIIATKA
jgi:SAM-dependent methyltransferase